MKHKNLFKNTAAAIVALFIAMLALPQTAQAGGTVTIDGEEKAVLSHEYDGGTGGFMLSLYLSEDKKEKIELELNKDFHVGKDIDLTEKESEHDGYYWAVVYYKGGSKVFNSFAKPGSSAAVFTTGTLRMDGDPAGTFTVRLSNGKITDNINDGKTHTISINYSSGEAETYAITVCEQPVTSANCHDLSSIDGVEGKVFYNPDTKTLTLENAVINTSATIIEVDKDDPTDEVYTIVVKGNNVLHSTYGHGLRFAGVNLNIKGSGSLTVNCDRFIALCIYKGNTTVSGGCSLTMKGCQGVNGWKEAGLTIDGSHFTAVSTGTEDYDHTMRNLTWLALNNCQITQPAGAAYDPSLMGVALDGTLLKGEVVIEPTPSGGTLLYEGFEQEGMPAGWKTIDSDGDGYDWTFYFKNEGEYTVSAHSGEGIATSYSYGDGKPLNPDNYLITPLVSGATKVRFYAMAQDKDYPADHFAVCASKTGREVSDFAIVEEWTMTAAKPTTRTVGQWYEYNVYLPAGTRYVAFRHYNCTDQFR
ncbi:choice-of-anchor J domain-containing protein, partial [Prevotella dentasini]